MAKKSDLEARCFAKYGCSWAQYQELLRIGRAMRKAGRSYLQTPTGAYSVHKSSARKRGIPWKFTLWTWWQTWQRSGRWEQRGGGQGYVMARFGDKGPYSPENVHIVTQRENISEGGWRQRSSLPMGVYAGRPGRYIAERGIGGVRYHIGSFDTPEEAHAAYLAFKPPQRHSNAA